MDFFDKTQLLPGNKMIAFPCGMENILIPKCEPINCLAGMQSLTSAEFIHFVVVYSQFVT